MVAFGRLVRLALVVLALLAAAPLRAAEVRVVGLSSRGLVNDPVRNLLYASVPGSVPAIGNSVVAIDPQTGSIVASVFVGSEPGQLAIDDAASVLYVALDGAASVRRVDLTSFTADLQFAVGVSPFDGPMFVEDIDVMPGTPGTVAISRRVEGVSPSDAGVAIYDDGIARAALVGGSNRIEFSDDPARIYGFDNETSSFDFHQLLVDATGVHEVSAVFGLIPHFNVDIVFDAGRVYATSGEVVDAEAATLAGSFAGVGAAGGVVPDAAAGLVYFVDTHGIVVFDASTFTQTNTIAIPMAGMPGNLVRWGADGLAFRTNAGELFLVRTTGSSIATTTTTSTTIPPAPDVREIHLRTNDLAYDSVRQKLYASVPGTVMDLGNSVVAIDPASGTVGPSVYVGSEPTTIAIDRDATTLYVALDGKATVRRLALSTFTPDLEFRLGQGFFGPLYADEMAVVPGSPASVAIARGNGPNVLAPTTIAVFDDGVARAGTAEGTRLAFGADSARLYSYNDGSTEYGFRRLRVDGAGVAQLQLLRGVILGFRVDIAFDDGRIYATTGKIIDAETGTLTGTLEGLGGGALVFPESAASRVWVLDGDTISELDPATFVLRGKSSVPGIAGAASALVRWGTDGLAFRTDADQVFLVRTSADPSTTTVTTTSTTTTTLAPLDVRELDLETGDLAYDPVRRLLYASVPASGGTSANSIVAIDPFRGTIGPSVVVGTDPGRLVIDRQATVLYVAVDGGATVRRVDLATFSPDLQFAVGTDPSYGVLLAEDMAVMPGSARTVAVSRRRRGVDPRYAGVGIYDDGVIRPHTSPTFFGSNRIEFADDPGRLYGMNNEGDYAFRRLAVDALGVTEIDATQGIAGFEDIVFEHGVIYASGGRAVLPEARVIAGTFPAVGFGATVAPDSNTNHAFFMQGDTLHVFDETTFVLKRLERIPGVSGTPANLVRWGEDGLAFRTSTGQLFLVQTGGATLDVRFLSVRPQLIDCRGRFAGSSTFDVSTGLTVRVRDGGTVDQEVRFQPTDCTTSRSGDVRCRGSDGRTRVRLSRIASGMSKFTLRLRNLELALPFTPGGVISLVEGRVARNGMVPAAACRVSPSRMRCQTP